MSRISIFDKYSNLNPLVILDLANNHNGSLEHGIRIVDEIYEVTKNFDFDFCIKFQYRDLPNFIHSDYRDRMDLKYINRFLSSKLHWEEYVELKNYIAAKGFLTACTPFDEFSVDKIIEHEFDFLKIASVSFTDWPLLEKVATWNGPIVASTAGVQIPELDRVVTFLKNREKDFALMHCVAAYPTNDKDLQLNRINALRRRFSDIRIGYSTHENPSNYSAAGIALGAGAALLERHVGSTTGGNAVNNYSSESAHLSSWLEALKHSIEMLGSHKPFSTTNVSESEALKGLRRYAFAKNGIPANSIFSFSDIFTAIPGEVGQLTANDFGKYSKYRATKDIGAGQAIFSSSVESSNTETKVFDIREKILGLISNSGVVVPKSAALEISHHYGIEMFDQYGSCMITVVNREYCKKLILLLPGQTHPDMFHKIKDETFFVLSGEIRLNLNGNVSTLMSGQTAEIPPQTVHGFSSERGAIIEEVSSNHSSSDSYYIDEAINVNIHRKTIVHYWL